MTMTAAISRVHPGSVLCLERGTYTTNSNIVLAKSGTPSHPIYYRSDGGTALIQYTGGSLSGGVLQTESGPNWRGTHDIVIEGLTIDGRNLIGGGIFVIQGSHHITIRNCVIRNTGSSGISLNATDYVTVVHNRVYRAGYNQGYSSGISLWYGGDSPVYGGRTAWYDRSPGFHNYIADNVVAGSYDSSRHHSDGGGFIVDGSGSIPPALIIDNLAYENGGPGFAVFQNSGDVWLVNDTAYADGLDLIEAHGRASDFFSLYANDVHWVDDLAYGRINHYRYTDAYTFRMFGSTINWAHNVGYNGLPDGVDSSTVSNRDQYVYGDPRFLSLPPIPLTASPWATAPPPWSISGEFELAPQSRALRAGVDPAKATGMTPALAGGLRRYMQLLGL